MVATTEQGVHVKDLQHAKRAATLKTRSLAGTNASELFGCLPADAYYQIPIADGQRYVVRAMISAPCDTRGWTCDNWTTRSDPAGLFNVFVKGSTGYPHSPIGALVGAISLYDAGGQMDQTESRRIFVQSFPVGRHRDDTAPFGGFLYLMFNDTWTFSDNHGSVHVTVTLF